MNGREAALGVKQYLTRLVKADGRAWNVYVSGKPGHLVLAPVRGHTNGLGGWVLPSEFWSVIPRKDLRPEVAKLIPRP